MADASSQACFFSVVSFQPQVLAKLRVATRHGRMGGGQKNYWPSAHSVARSLFRCSRRQVDPSVGWCDFAHVGWPSCVATRPTLVLRREVLPQRFTPFGDRLAGVGLHGEELLQRQA